MKKISIVVPFFNEATILPQKVKELHEYCKKNIDGFEIIFVDDGSTDRSYKIVSQYCKKSSSLHIITYKKNKGRGGAITKGMLRAGGEIIGYLDCDLEIRPHYIPKAIKILQEVDIVIASKFEQGSRIDTPTIRKVSSILYNLITRALLDSEIHDHQAGFKFFKNIVIHDILRVTKEKGWLWDTEVLYTAQKKNYTIHELPIAISYGYRKMRGSFFVDFLKLPFVLVKLRKKIDRRLSLI